MKRHFRRREMIQLVMPRRMTNSLIAIKKERERMTFSFSAGVVVTLQTQNPDMAVFMLVVVYGYLLCAPCCLCNAKSLSRLDVVLYNSSALSVFILLMVQLKFCT